MFIRRASVTTLLDQKTVVIGLLTCSCFLCLHDLFFFSFVLEGWSVDYHKDLQCSIFDVGQHAPLEL